MALLLTQKNTFFELVENHRAFSPYQFHYEEDKPSKNIGFTYIGSEYFFKIFESKHYVNSYVANFSPGGEELVFLSELSFINPKIYNYFSSWLNNLEREIKAPNKWERLIMDIKSFSLPNNSCYNADRFTYQEYTEVVRNISQLKEGIKEIGLTSEQYNIIDEKLDFLIEQGQSLKKFDWRSLFIGTIINIATNIIINPTSIQAFYELVKVFFLKLLM